VYTVLVDFVVDRLQFLGLNDREVRVFTALATFGRMNMTKVANRSSLPRTTVDAIIRRLVKQGLVSKEKVRGHYEYFVNTDEVANTLDWIEKRFRTDTNVDGEVDVRERMEHEENKVYNEKKILKQDEGYLVEDLDEKELSFDTLALRHKGDRVRLLFSRGEKGKEERVLRFSKYAAIAIEHELKLEVLLDSTVAAALTEEDSVPIPPRSDLIRLNIVPALYGAAVEDVFMFKDSLLLINTHRNIRHKVEERELVDLSKHLLEIACETGWSVDLTAWMNKE